MTPIDPIEVAFFVGFATFGALLFVLVHIKCWKEIKEFRYIRHLLLGPFIGFLYYCLYSEYNFPNTVMSIVSGYMGTEFIVWTIELLKKSLEKKKDE